MPERDHTKRTATSVNLAGTLVDSLVHHASERCRHFFLYLFFYKALTDRPNAVHNRAFSPNGGVNLAATHQVDSGMRIKAGTEKRESYYGFSETDPEIVKKAATACGETDASHFCNLGIEAKFQAEIANLAKHHADRISFDLYEALKAICGNTKWLPQRVNIGPDRVIDELHGVLAMQMLNGKPPVSATNRAAYIKEARKNIAAYGEEKRRAGLVGLTACADAYIEFYDDGEKIHDMWMVVTGNVSSECYALGLPLDAYLRRTVA